MKWPITSNPQNKAALASTGPLSRVARAILFLASDAASFVTGQIVTSTAARQPADTFPPFEAAKEKIMTAHTHNTAPTQYVETNGVRFAYRRFGKSGGVPLVFNHHFTGTMDHWDPAVTDGPARDREVILFNNGGFSSSSGAVPTSLEEMGADAVAFIKGLEFTKVDVLGFSRRSFRS